MILVLVVGLSLDMSSAEIRANPWPAASQFVKPFTNSTKLRNAIPDGPLAIHGF